jgi:hypothetical protein
VLLLEICGCKLSHWFKFNLEGDLDWIADIRWKELWATICYYLWIWRNKDIHDASFIRTLQPVQFVMQRSREYRDACKAQCIVSERPRSTVLIGWKPTVDG